MERFNWTPKKNCCVPGCSGSLVMHRFPEDQTLSQLWLVIIDNPDLQDVDRRVCRLHFAETSYVPKCGKKLLKKDALPSLHLKVFEKTSIEKDAELLVLDQASTHNTHSDVEIEDSEALRETPKVTVKKSSILKELNVTRQLMLTPKARCLYKKVVRTSNTIAQMSSRIKSFKDRLNCLCV